MLATRLYPSLGLSFLLVALTSFEQFLRRSVGSLFVFQDNSVRALILFLYKTLGDLHQTVLLLYKLSAFFRKIYFLCQLAFVPTEKINGIYKSVLHFESNYVLTVFLLPVRLYLTKRSAYSMALFRRANTFFIEASKQEYLVE